MPKFLHEANAFVLLLAAALRAAARAGRHAPQPQPQPQPAQPSRSPNALTPATAARAIQEPRIQRRAPQRPAQRRVPAHRRRLLPHRRQRRRAAAAARLHATPRRSRDGADALRRAGQRASPISRASTPFVEKLRDGDAGSASTPSSIPPAASSAILAGDFADSAAAEPLRDQLDAARLRQGHAHRPPRRRNRPFEKQHQIVDDEGRSTTIAGESLLVMPVDRGDDRDRQRSRTAPRRASSSTRAARSTSSTS